MIPSINDPKNFIPQQISLKKFHTFVGSLPPRSRSNLMTAALGVLDAHRINLLQRILTGAVSRDSKVNTQNTSISHLFFRRITETKASGRLIILHS